MQRRAGKNDGKETKLCTSHFHTREARGLLDHAVEIVVTARGSHGNLGRLEAMRQVTSGVIAFGVIQTCVQRLQKAKAILLDADGVIE